MLLTSCATTKPNIKPPVLSPPTVEAGPMPLDVGYRVKTTLPIEFLGVQTEVSVECLLYSETSGKVNVCASVPAILVEPLCVDAEWPPKPSDDLPDTLPTPGEEAP